MQSIRSVFSAAMYEFAIHAQSGSASGLIAVGSRPAGVGGWEGSRSSDGSQFFSRAPFPAMLMPGRLWCSICSSVAWLL